MTFFRVDILTLKIEYRMDAFISLFILGLVCIIIIACTGFCYMACRMISCVQILVCLVFSGHDLLNNIFLLQDLLWFIITNQCQLLNKFQSAKTSRQNKQKMATRRTQATQTSGGSVINLLFVIKTLIWIKHFVIIWRYWSSIGCFTTAVTKRRNRSG